MSPLIRVVLAGAAGALAAEFIEPKLVEAIKPTSPTMVKGIHYGSIGAGTGVAWYLTGMFVKG